MLPGWWTIFWKFSPKPGAWRWFSEHPPLEQAWGETFRREFEGFAGRVEFDWLVGLPLPELLEKVSRLPSGTAVLHGLFLVDPDGFVNERNEVLRRL